MSACHFCGATLDPKMRIVRDTECPSCGRDLHACVQCRNFDRSAHNMCREPQAEWVTDRERRNFCDYFSLNPVGGRGAGVPDREKSAREKLDSFFTAGPAKPTRDETRAKLDSLFQPKPPKSPKAPEVPDTPDSEDDE
jgi:predicted RNA-binding Zn-ribbon protein involved in translation (DUF1610 family)